MESYETRLWRGVDKTETCWLWLGCLLDGYGVMKVGGRSGRPEKVHRIVYELLRGPLSAGHLHHTCHVRRCCNPDHLLPMTASEHSRHHQLSLTPKYGPPAPRKQRSKEEARLAYAARRAEDLAYAEAYWLARGEAPPPSLVMNM